MRTPLLALVLFVSAPALAGVSLTLQTGGQTSASVGQNSCDAQVSVNYQVSGQPPCNDVRIWLTTATTCSDQPGEKDVVIDALTPEEITLAPSGTVFFRVRDLPSFTTESPCGAADLELSNRVCASYQAQRFDVTGTSCESQWQKTSSPPRVDFDSRPPPAPAITEVTSKDSALAVRVAADDAVRVRVLVRPASSVEPFSGSAEGSPGALIQVLRLNNGQEYEVRAVSEDGAGNVSPESQPALGTPVKTIGFWGAYCSAGNECESGCGAAVGGPTLLGLMLALSALRRRKS